MNSYKLAQRALANLKAAVHGVLLEAGAGGLTNAEIGRTLGIYAGHVGHEGHIPRTLLAMMESEGVVEQNKESKRWSLKPRISKASILDAEIERVSQE
jgi:DNA-binding IclR family transcriptional regulator